MTSNDRWWSSLRHGGLLISPSRLSLLRNDPPEPLSAWLAGRLRADLTRLATGSPDARRQLLDTVFEQVCGLSNGDSRGWLKGSGVTAEWSRRGAAGEVLKPRRVWQGLHDAVLPVFVDEEPRLGIGRGRRAVSRVLEWLRASDSRLAVVTNHEQFRLIYAGPDYDASAEWDIALWFEEGAPAAQVEALRWLLSPETLTPPRAGARAPLLEAIEQSRRGQAELSASLGERVRRAVEALIQAYGEPLAELPDKAITRRDIYIAATRVVMRMVVVLFAEARDLLPRDNPRYESSYGLQALRASLDRVTGAARARRRFHHGSWPRLLGLFRLMYDGSHHPELLIRRYGGGLFAPGDSRSVDPISRALAVFEDSERGPHDDTVARILDLLCRTEMRVRVGNTLKAVSAPVDFSDLSSEYIGTLYEGLLDYELRRAEPDDPLVFLDLGDQPVLPLSRLEAMGDDDLKNLVERATTSRRALLRMEEEGADSEETEEEEQPDQELEKMADDLSVEEVGGEPDPATATAEPASAEDAPTLSTDQEFLNKQRAHDWAVRAVKASGLVAKPRSRKAEELAGWEEQVQVAARELITRIVQPGEWFLVLWGGTRKGSGTFYTRPQLAVPTVQRTLRPLAYDPPASSGEAPSSEWVPKSPESILALKVCDPAVGSGSFLVASLRFLADALWRSLLEHKWLTEESDRFVVRATGVEPPPWFSECVRDLPVTAGDAESHVRARLRRVVVERCLYGVDLDPLAIELARLSLWVETMDRDLPFEFLDHRLKVGNALVGCWFDRFRDYPAMAWMREGGDASHDNFIHHFRSFVATRGKKKGEEQKAGDKWTTAIKEWRDTRVKPALVNAILGQGSFFENVEGRPPETLHDEAVALLREMEVIPIHEPDERARFYRDRLQASPAFRRLIEAFDTWCALWFWPADRVDLAPMPNTFADPGSEAREIVQDLTLTHRFFHWELEFADVFAVPGSGFDAIIGNPPWEIQKPNSKEFFSNIDPMYRSYGKQEAIRRQSEIFGAHPSVEISWVSYVGRYKALSNWNRNATSPFGDKAEGDETFALERGRSALHDLWRTKRIRRGGYADPGHPFKHQGSADINTYKMFLEQSHVLLRSGGRLALITPAAFYGDKGALSLRRLFLESATLTDLYAFQNEKQVFPEIHHAYKMCVLFVQKGGSTRHFRALFSLGIAHSPSAGEVEDQLMRFGGALSVSREQIDRFSPTSRSLMEVRSHQELTVLDSLVRHAVLLGEKSPNHWSVEYLREFDMTNDSDLFPPRPTWQERGFVADEYGQWIGAEGEIALPLYEGRMVGQFDFQRKGWVSGKGRRAVWREIPWSDKTFAPQFLMSAKDFASARDEPFRWKVAFMDVAASNVERTMIATLLYGVPCGNSAPTLTVNGGDLAASSALMAVLNSFAYDFIARRRCTGLHLNWFLVSETAIPALEANAIWQMISVRASALALPHVRFAPGHLYFRSKFPGYFGGLSWKAWWAVSRTERLRQRCILDALVAHLYGLSFDEFKIVLSDTDHPAESLADREFASRVDSKAFWLVDHQESPELRHSVLALVAFRELERVGLEAFAGLNGGEGWALPETLRLDDYGLGHDARAKESQPVRARLGERLFSWQLEQSVEESWAECERHARNVLGPEGYARLQDDIQNGGRPKGGPAMDSVGPTSAGASQRRLFPGEANLFGDKSEDPV